MNKLSGEKRKKIHDAILNAYPSMTRLKMMVSFELDRNLDEIARNSNLAEAIFELIEWAESTGKVKELVEGAYKGNPDNLYVRKQYYNIPRSFEFETATLGENLQINYSRGRAESFKEDLGNSVLLEMVKIPGGSFLMGSPENEPERFDVEGPQHRVNIQPFFMGKFPVTQEQYQAIMGENPSYFKGEKRPVECVSWDNAVVFCARISQKTGKTYRLPSEAEWEYACRAGTRTPFYFGETISTDLANYRGTDWNYEGTLYPGNYGSGSKGEFREKTTDVGSFPANAFGLYDMHGNVFEWCQDVAHYNYNGAPVDGTAWMNDENDNHYRMLRGGSWDFGPRSCRCAYRGRVVRDGTGSNLGFRVVVASPRTF